MSTKVTEFIKLLCDMICDNTVGVNYPGTWKIGLYNASTAFDYAYTWADIMALECSFKGYARINITSFNTATEPVTGKWQRKTPPLTFAYDSGGSGLTAEDAYGWFVIFVESGTEHLMEFKDLAAPYTFDSDGDELPLEWKFISLNCDE